MTLMQSPLSLAVAVLMSATLHRLRLECWCCLHRQCLQSYQHRHRQFPWQHSNFRSGVHLLGLDLPRRRPSLPLPQATQALYISWHLSYQLHRRQTIQNPGRSSRSRRPPLRSDPSLHHHQLPLAIKASFQPRELDLLDPLSHHWPSRCHRRRKNTCGRHCHRHPPLVPPCCDSTAIRNTCTAFKCSN